MKVLIGKINTFCCMKKKSLIEDKRNNKEQKPHTRQNPKRHMSLVSLFLCRKIAAVRYFIWRLGFRMWSGSEVVKQLDEILGFTIF